MDGERSLLHRTGLPAEIAAHPLPQIRGGGSGSRFDGLSLMPGLVRAPLPILLYSSAEGISTVVPRQFNFCKTHVIPVQDDDQESTQIYLPARSVVEGFSVVERRR